MNEETTQFNEQPQKAAWSTRKRVFVIISVVVGLVVLYFGGSILLVVFVAQPVRVQGMAMAPTLNDGDKIFVRKQFDTLQRGDIVIFYYPADTTKSFIKRIIGLPGEKIGVDSEGNVTINGQIIREDYIVAERNQNARERWGRVQRDWKEIKEGYYFMMGDNRDASNDSRSWGLVSKDLIYGKYWVRYGSSN
nr:Methyltransferase domain protein [uncultured bacterium]